MAARKYTTILVLGVVLCEPAFAHLSGVLEKAHRVLRLRHKVEACDAVPTLEELINGVNQDPKFSSLFMPGSGIDAFQAENLMVTGIVESSFQEAQGFCTDLGQKMAKRIDVDIRCSLPSKDQWATIVKAHVDARDRREIKPPVDFDPWHAGLGYRGEGFWTAEGLRFVLGNISARGTNGESRNDGVKFPKQKLEGRKIIYMTYGKFFKPGEEKQRFVEEAREDALYYKRLAESKEELSNDLVVASNLLRKGKKNEMMTYLIGKHLVSDPNQSEENRGKLLPLDGMEMDVKKLVKLSEELLLDVKYFENRAHQTEKEADIRETFPDPDQATKARCVCEIFPSKHGVNKSVSCESIKHSASKKKTIRFGRSGGKTQENGNSVNKTH